VCVDDLAVTFHAGKLFCKNRAVAGLMLGLAFNVWVCIAQIFVLTPHVRLFTAPIYDHNAYSCVTVGGHIMLRLLGHVQRPALQVAMCHHVYWLSGLILCGSTRLANYLLPGSAYAHILTYALHCTLGAGWHHIIAASLTCAAPTNNNNQSL
jgi:hypothetical protein